MYFGESESTADARRSSNISMLKQETMKARQKGPRVHAMVKGAPSSETGASIGGDGVRGMGGDRS